jgi:DNA-binding response OmpR family regulator
MMRAERFTVLVVNDEPLLHRILHASLRSSGFVVEKARTAEEALAVMRERTFEVALLYINIPRANGADFCRQMRPGESSGIVMVSAQDAEIDMVQALESGKISKREWMKFMEAALHKRGTRSLI